MEKLDPKTHGISPDFVTENVAQLRQIFPDVFTEGQIDFDALRQVLGDHIEHEPERYGLNWSGKSSARLIALSPSTATLRPDLNRSTQWGRTRNVFVEGDNLEVLKVLQKSYHRKVKLVYVDPPYNTGNEVLYPGGHSESLDTYLRYSGQSDEKLHLPINSRASGRYHTDWLNMMYPRLKLARNLLTDDGYLVVSIDDNELKNLQHLLDELFGEENRLAVLVLDRNRKNDARFFSVGHEYMVVYARDKSTLSRRGVTLRMPKEGVEEIKELFNRLRSQHEDDWAKVKEGIDAHFGTYGPDDPRLPLKRFTKVDERGPYRTDGDASWPGGGGPRYDVPHPITGKPCTVPSRGWVWPTYERMREEIEQGNVVFGEDEKKIPSRRRNLFDASDQVMRSVTYSYAQKTAQDFAQLFDGRKVYDNPKDPEVMRKLIDYLTEPDDLIFDLFSGSATTAHGVLLSNTLNGSSRRFLCIQLPEVLGDKGATDLAARELCAQVGVGPTVFSIGLERFRRAAQTIHAEAEQDMGFCVFSLAESNIKSWIGDAEDLDELLLEAIDNIRSDRSEQDVLYELLIKYGLELTMPVDEREIEGRRVFVIGFGALVVCLDEDIDFPLMQGIVDLKNELDPAIMRVVLRDSGFRDDIVKTNAFQILKRAGIEDARSL